MNQQEIYIKSLSDGITMMECCEELEPRSALKQAASDNGIEYGDDMEKFINWAESQLF
jgi:hypothetical protein